jgi:HSP20 family molecular chaperone IbpA
MSNQTEVTRNAGNGKGTSQQQTKTARLESILRPAVDIYESDEGITLQADMPGVSKERLNLRIEGSTLLLEGTIGISPQDQMTALHADVRSTVYQRSFTLNNGFEVDKVDAELKDGVLTVRLPKRAELRPRRIEITS